MWNASIISLFVVTLVTSVSAESVPEFKWRAVEIDAIEIGYGLQMADVNGDGLMAASPACGACRRCDEQIVRDRPSVMHPSATAVELDASAPHATATVVRIGVRST